MKLTPRLAHFVSLSTPSPGATPAARQSRFRGVPGFACTSFMRGRTFNAPEQLK
ncbi:hypothetical protein FHW64_002691 [Variovorax sp. Sphag1AA]|nr:hypothetical protein [Variovorax sp. Sphag1AA]